MTRILNINEVRIPVGNTVYYTTIDNISDLELTRHTNCFTWLRKHKNKFLDVVNGSKPQWLARGGFKMTLWGETYTFLIGADSFVQNDTNTIVCGNADSYLSSLTLWIQWIAVCKEYCNDHIFLNH
jgi:hypothetical protein